MRNLIKALIILTCFTALTSCRYVTSTPIFQDGRLSAAALNALEGTYSSSGDFLIVSRAAQANDLLDWRIITKDTSEEYASGQAVLSQVPQSNIFLALLIDLKLFSDQDSPERSAVVFIKRIAPDVFVVLPNDRDSAFSMAVDAISDPEQQADFILRYAVENRAALAELEGEGYVLLDPDSHYLYPALRENLPAQSASNGQCISQVQARLLYCREEWDNRGANTVYYIECNSRVRSENRACRGWYRNESTYPAVGFEPYFCDPQTDIKGPTAESVTGQVCR